MPASITASRSGFPSARRSLMKSTRMIEFRTTMPAPAMKPIIEVAVKNALSADPSIFQLCELVCGSLKNSTPAGPSFSAVEQ
jgi:hypothetical protein